MCFVYDDLDNGKIMLRGCVLFCVVLNFVQTNFEFTFPHILGSKREPFFLHYLMRVAYHFLLVDRLAEGVLRGRLRCWRSQLGVHLLHVMIVDTLKVSLMVSSGFLRNYDLFKQSKWFKKSPCKVSPFLPPLVEHPGSFGPVGRPFCSLLRRAIRLRPLQHRRHHRVHRRWQH